MKRIDEKIKALPSSRSSTKQADLQDFMQKMRDDAKAQDLADPRSQVNIDKRLREAKPLVQVTPKRGEIIKEKII
jgi:hypothetical protein